MSSFVDNYYQTEWKKNCPKDATFITTWQGLAFCSHSMLAVFLPFYIFTAFCILKKTPRSMSSIKFVLLNTHFWCCFVDILACSLITPYFYFPMISGFPVGLLRVLGIPTSIQIYLGLYVIFFMSISILALFENRSSCIPNNRFRITKRTSRFLYYFTFCTFFGLALLPVLLNIPDQATAKITFLRVIPCPSEEFFYSDVFIMINDDFWELYLLTTLGVIILSLWIQFLFFSAQCLYYLYFSTSVVLSPQTKKYQQSFFLGIVVQASVPTAFLFIPISSGMASIYFKFYSQVLNSVVVLIFSLHGIASTIVMLLVHHPYRCYLIKMITFNTFRVDKNASGAYVVARDARQAVRTKRLKHVVIPNSS